jgi:hypothetical protein
VLEEHYLAGEDKLTNEHPEQDPFVIGERCQVATSHSIDVSEMRVSED